MKIVLKVMGVSYLSCHGGFIKLVGYFVLVRFNTSNKVGICLWRIYLINISDLYIQFQLNLRT